MRRYNTTRLWGSTKLRGSTHSLGNSQCDWRMGKIECVIHHIMKWNDVRCKLSTMGSPEYKLPVTLSDVATPVSPYMCPSSVHFQHPCIAVHQLLVSLLPSWVVVLVSTGFSHHNGICFAHRPLRLLVLLPVHYVTSWCRQLRILLSKGNINALLLQSIVLWLFCYSI